MSHPEIPERIRALAAGNHIGPVARKDIAKARAAMDKLSIPRESEFYAFCSEIRLGNLLSPSSYEALVDVSEPSEQVAVGTNFVREVWGLPSEFICFTTCEGEGAYLFSTKTQSVYDFSLAERNRFIASPEPQWATFFSFIEWYLSPPTS